MAYQFHFTIEGHLENEPTPLGDGASTLNSAEESPFSESQKGKHKDTECSTEQQSSLLALG
ncbi:Histidine protein methyltransferase 1 like protein [Myotis davidii]|uniref:Histidine protein methyltransferase 1 like protein n=2 Tax=Myotis davidii TaxID=225400 RepID=L5LUY1_MYODS|nr:Histidine protein methyltransferase 1 like protein [Myotis davidii]